MNLLDRVQVCHRRDMAGYRPFLADGARIGWIGRVLADRLRGFPAVFRVEPDAVVLRPEGRERRSRAMAEVAAALRDEGLIAGWRDELFPVAPSVHGAPLFAIERAAVKPFGIRYACVQLNGTVGEGAETHMWIARRALSKPIGPGKLDQIVGGGVPMGLSPAEALVKECAEEAGIPEDLARRARPVGAIALLAEEDGGLWNEIMFNYDLELPADFTPGNVDGEVESFHLLPIAEVRRILESGDEFLFDVAPVIVDHLIRHGHVGPEEPDYVALAELLATAPP
jgi:8-oxo-dGTP pyrophosphatase MutT (NUDIX family)